jgi:putative flippase GtrA
LQDHGCSVDARKFDRKPPAEKSLSDQALRYLLLSGLSFGGNLGLTVLLHEWIGLSSLVAVPIAMVFVTLLNFVTLKLFIFNHGEQGWAKQLGGFVASIAAFRVTEYAAFVVIHGLLGTPYVIAYASILTASAVCKFLFLRNILFAGPRPPVSLTEPLP